MSSSLSLRRVPWKAEKQIIIKPLARTKQIGAGWASVSVSFLSLRRMKVNKSSWKKFFINPVCTCREDTLRIALSQRAKRKDKKLLAHCAGRMIVVLIIKASFFIIECKNTWKYTQQTRQQIRMAFVSIVPPCYGEREALCAFCYIIHNSMCPRSSHCRRLCCPNRYKNLHSFARSNEPKLHKWKRDAAAACSSFLRFSARRSAATRVPPTLSANLASKSGYLFRGFAVRINIARAALQSSRFGLDNAFKYHDPVKRITQIWQFRDSYYTVAIQWEL